MKKGFTLIELLLAAALIFIFAGLTLPVGFNFYQEATLRDQTRNLANSLRKAQAIAITGRADSDAGVKIEGNRYIIFERESYEEFQRGTDLAIPLPIALSISGTDEIVFRQTSGLPSFEEEEKIIILEFGSHLMAITVNSQGKIEITETYEPDEE